MNRLLYYALRFYVWCALHVYFRKIIVIGSENIPRNEPVLFLANHQNAMLDALVVAVTVGRYCYFIARADVFRYRFVSRLLSAINMRPVYRLRDGIKSIPNNKHTFTWAANLLLRGECLLFFPEGNHSLQRRVRPLSKGFTRIVDETLRENPTLNLRIVPVGITYTDHTGFGGSVNVYYGEPLEAEAFKNNPASLRKAMEEKLKTLTVHVEDEPGYHEVIRKLEKSAPNYLDVAETNQRIRRIEAGADPVGFTSKIRSAKSRHRWLVYPLYILCWVINAVPLIGWRALKKKITDPVFTGTFRFALGITVVPLVYTGWVLLAAMVFNWPAAFAVGLFCVSSLPLYKAGKRTIG